MKFHWIGLLILALALVTAGCQGASDTSTPAPAENGGEADEAEDEGSDDAGSATSAIDTEGTTMVAIYCGSCGHVKDSEACCNDECEKCECGLHKGSELCCKVEGDAQGKDICSACGHEASENCCKDGCEVCEECGLHKGAALCCA